MEESINLNKLAKWLSQADKKQNLNAMKYFPSFFKIYNY